MANKEVLCKYCGKKLSNNFCLNRHIKSVHRDVILPKSSDKYNYICLEDGCKESFRERSNLVKHLQTTHELEINSEEIHFHNCEEFQVWKSTTEQNESCFYVKHGYKKVTSEAGDCETNYYYCNRSRRNKGYQIRENRKRKIKKQGLSRSNKCCTSGMVVTITKNKVIVLRTVTHYGHDKDLHHIPISRYHKNIIAEKLAMGVSIERILQEAKIIPSPELRRMGMITRRDVENIMKSYGIQKAVDAEENVNPLVHSWTSIHVFVVELWNSRGNPILFYKQQGSSSFFLSEEIPLAKDDFCLILMSGYQENMLKTFGTNAIIVDSTTGLENYDFNLMTVLIVDDFDEVFPVAYMFTNRTCKEISRFFFKKIKEKSGELQCKLFISDTRSVLYTSWKDVMGSAGIHLYSTWHVEHAWKNDLNNFKVVERRKWIYDTLKSLQTNTSFENQESFLDELDKLIRYLMGYDRTVHFGFYFQNAYKESYKKWAHYFWDEFGFNKTKKIESFFDSVKYFRVNNNIKSLEKGFHAVMKYTRDRTIERLIKKSGKLRIVPEITGQLLEKHSIAVASDFEVISHENSKWEIKNEGTNYEIINILSRNCCANKCPFCDVCIHRISCTCPDYYINNTICKHIHYIRIKYFENVSESQSTEVSQGIPSDIEVCLAGAELIFISDNDNCVEIVNDIEGTEKALEEMTNEEKRITILNEFEELKKTLCDKATLFNDVDVSYFVSVFRDLNSLLKT